MRIKIFKIALIFVVYLMIKTVIDGQTPWEKQERENQCMSLTCCTPRELALTMERLRQNSDNQISRSDLKIYCIEMKKERAIHDCIALGKNESQCQIETDSKSK